MAYTRKTRDEWQVQALYGHHGWECVGAHDTRREAIAERRCYDENEPYPHRVRCVRIKIEVA